MCLGIPGKVVKTFHEHDVLMGKVDFGGVSKQVCLEHVPDVKLGEYVLVHVGFALSKIDEEEAGLVFKFLETMNQLDELAGDSPGGVDEPPRVAARPEARPPNGTGTAYAAASPPLSSPLSSHARRRDAENAHDADSVAPPLGAEAIAR